MSRASAAAAAGLAAATITACGSGPSLSDYKKGFQTDKAQFTQLGSALSTTLQQAGRSSDVVLAGQFSSLASRASQQAAQLRKLKPPSKYKSQNDQLASGFDTVAADMRSLAIAVGAHNATTARAGTRKLLQDAASLKSVDRSLTSSLGLPQTS